VWSSLIHFLLYLDKPTGGKQGEQNEHSQQTETLPTTEEPRTAPFSTPEDHHPNSKVTHSVRIMDEVQTYNEVLKSA